MSPAQSEGPYNSSRFLVEIDGIVTSDFTRVVLPESRVDVLHSVEGGAVAGILHFGPLTLIRSVTQSRELYDWWHSVVSGHRQRRNLAVVLYDEAGQEAVRWKVHNAWPTRYEVSPFDLGVEDVVVETLELVCEGVERS